MACANSHHDRESRKIMIYFVVYLLFGATAIAILVGWAVGRRRPAPGRTDDSLILLIEALTRRPQDYAGRIFDQEDWQFVCASVGKDERVAFLRARTRLAVMWLNEIRGHVARIMQL